MTGFPKPSPEMEAVYQQIFALTDEGVWVPAISNGGLRQLLAEMEIRGWKVIPPLAQGALGDKAVELLSTLVAEAGIPQFGINQDIPKSFWDAWMKAKDFLERGGKKK